MFLCLCSCLFVSGTHPPSVSSDFGRCAATLSPNHYRLRAVMVLCASILSSTKMFTVKFPVYICLDFCEILRREIHKMLSSN